MLFISFILGSRVSQIGGTFSQAFSEVQDCVHFLQLPNSQSEGDFSTVMGKLATVSLAGQKRKVTGLQVIEEVTGRSDKFVCWTKMVCLFPSWLLEQSWACCAPPFPFTSILWTADPHVHGHKAACILARTSSSWPQALLLDLLCKPCTFICPLLTPGMILEKPCILHFSCLLWLRTLGNR